MQMKNDSGGFKARKLGVIGCGTISEAYFKAARTFPILEITACADINPVASARAARTWGIEALSVEALLARDDIEIVLNLTVHHHTNHPVELHGETGSLQVPDPNTFGGAVKVRTAGTDEWQDQPLINAYTGNVRGIGAADLAYALTTQRPHRCHSDLAMHVLDVMQAIHESSEQGEHILIQSCCERPAPLPVGVAYGGLGDEGKGQ